MNDPSSEHISKIFYDQYKRILLNNNDGFYDTSSVDLLIRNVQFIQQFHIIYISIYVYPIYDTVQYTAFNSGDKSIFQVVHS